MTLHADSPDWELIWRNVHDGHADRVRDMTQRLLAMARIAGQIELLAELAVKFQTMSDNLMRSGRDNANERDIKLGEHFLDERKEIEARITRLTITLGELEKGGTS